jgi:hypothetical protein
MKTLLVLSLIALLLNPFQPVNADLLSRGTAGVLKHIGAEALETNARQAAEKAAHKAVKSLGAEGAEFAIERGGLALLEAGAHHGDVVWDLAKRVPEAARYIGSQPEHALSIGRHFGDDAVRLEAMQPGLGERAASIFGRDRLPALARADTSEVSALLAYAQKADKPATRDVLFDLWSSRGHRILKELDQHKKLILTGGLTAAILTVAQGGADGIRKIPDRVPPQAFAKGLDQLSAGAANSMSIVAMGLAVALLLWIWLRRPTRPDQMIP